MQLVEHAAGWACSCFSWMEFYFSYPSTPSAEMLDWYISLMNSPRLSIRYKEALDLGYPPINEWFLEFSEQAFLESIFIWLSFATDHKSIAAFVLVLFRIQFSAVAQFLHYFIYKNVAKIGKKWSFSFIKIPLMALFSLKTSKYHKYSLWFNV